MKFGHATENCWTALREAKEAGADKSTFQRDKDSFDRSYQPSFSRPYTVQIACLVVSSAEIQSTASPNDWVIDSAANCFITPFKDTLRNYVDFKEPVIVKGFKGRTEIATGKGSVTLFDATGNRLTLDDIVYVDGSPDQILSLMKLRREYAVDFYFTGIEEFVIATPSQFQIAGQSVNDICHMWTTSPLQVAVVTTHGTTKRK